MIIVVWLVTEVRGDLSVNAAARDITAGNRSRHRRVVVPSCRPIKLDLITAAIGGGLDGVQIDLPAVNVGERHRGRQPVPDDLEPVAEKQLPNPINRRHVHNEIEVLVFSGLPADERVNAPPSVDPCRHASLRETIENIKDLLGSHHKMLPDRYSTDEDGTVTAVVKGA